MTVAYLGEHPHKFFAAQRLAAKRDRLAQRAEINELLEDLDNDPFDVVLEFRDVPPRSFPKPRGRVDRKRQKVNHRYA